MLCIKSPNVPQFVGRKTKNFDKKFLENDRPNAEQFEAAASQMNVISESLRLWFKKRRAQERNPYLAQFSKSASKENLRELKYGKSFVMKMIRYSDN